MYCRSFLAENKRLKNKKRFFRAENEKENKIRLAFNIASVQL